MLAHCVLWGDNPVNLGVNGYSHKKIQLSAGCSILDLERVERGNFALKKKNT